MKRVSVLLIGAALLASGCANNKAAREEDLGRIGEWLPGAYDNRAQVDADLAHNVADVPTVALDIVAVRPTSSATTYTCSKPTRRIPSVLSQQLYSFEMT
jgi:hypothetical protein